MALSERIGVPSVICWVVDVVWLSKRGGAVIAELTNIMLIEDGDAYECPSHYIILARTAYLC